MRIRLRGHGPHSLARGLEGRLYTAETPLLCTNLLKHRTSFPLAPKLRKSPRAKRIVSWLPGNTTSLAFPALDPSRTRSPCLSSSTASTAVLRTQISTRTGQHPPSTCSSPCGYITFHQAPRRHMTQGLCKSEGILLRPGTRQAYCSGKLGSTQAAYRATCCSGYSQGK